MTIFIIFTLQAFSDEANELLPIFNKTSSKFYRATVPTGDWSNQVGKTKKKAPVQIWWTTSVVFVWFYIFFVCCLIIHKILQNILQILWNFKHLHKHTHTLNI